MTGNPFDMSAAGGPEDGAAATGESFDRRPPSPYRAQMRRANALLGTLFLAAGVGIYVWSLRRGPATASAEQQQAEQQVDIALARMAAEDTAADGAPAAGRMSQRVLGYFYEEVTDRQVPLKDLRKNPFFFTAPSSSQARPPVAVPTPPPPADPPAQEPSEKAALAAFGRLHLQSVMMGRAGSSSAIISNNLLTVGATIDGFVVKAIHPKSVVLTWNDRDFVLEMP